MPSDEWQAVAMQASLKFVHRACVLTVAGSNPTGVLNPGSNTWEWVGKPSSIVLVHGAQVC
jgi:hypothetical protein